MIKINVAQIKKRLVGEKPLAFDLEPAELEISPEEMGIIGTVKLVGSMSNAGDVLLLQAHMECQVQRTCGRCLQEFVGVTKAEVVEKFYGIGRAHVTLAEVGEDMNLKRERVRQIRDKALRKISKNAKTKALKVFLKK